MRLLKTGPFVSGQSSTLELHEFRGHKERFAILSHTWSTAGHDEILFTDLLAHSDPAIRKAEGHISVNLDAEPSIKEKPGWAKLAFALEQADQDGKEWLWVDTACIDRSSSAELNEAINSAYEWCQGSAICYALLEDVPLEEWHEMKYGKSRTLNSRWFTRGWTLTELLAPGHVVFYSMEWIRLGDKHELSGMLSTATGIDVSIIEDNNLVEIQSVAKRFSWAANRETTLPEDRAYSIMGLMGVNMSVLYGEGEKKAFIRLQQEIIKSCDDPSIFAWTDHDVGDRAHGLLADSPKAFAASARYFGDPYEEQQPFEMTNRGLGICVHLMPADQADHYVAALQCPDPGANGRFLAIQLRKLARGDRQYVRVRCDEIGSVEHRGKLEQIFVRQSIPPLGVFPSAISLQPNGVPPPPKDEEPSYSTRMFHINKFRAWGAFEVLDVQFQPPKFSNKDAKGVLKELKHPTGVPDQLPVTFRVTKEGPLLSAAMLVGTADIQAPRVAILLGTGSDREPGFDIVECQSLEELKTCSKAFDTIDFGSMAFGKHYRVMIRAETMVKADVKVWLVEIGVGGLEKAMKHDSPTSLQRTDSSRTNGSRMSWIVQKVVRRHSRVSSVDVAVNGNGERGSTSSRSVEGAAV
ncbi:hypothetical protein PRZ48_009251 [Zasmidium cellare]|uniref:Heterokaryon incompatibility domain-containing protein n=1 Tax=Zasmidium cellare TaxID=395010 RepID=A0ABR0EBV3_ZASCE|nr:hypothetical protein PRZ48_009251 [Zasmidium cellare]